MLAQAGAHVMGHQPLWLVSKKGQQSTRVATGGFAELRMERRWVPSAVLLSLPAYDNAGGLEASYTLHASPSCPTPLHPSAERTARGSASHEKPGAGSTRTPTNASRGT